MNIAGCRVQNLERAENFLNLCSRFQQMKLKSQQNRCEFQKNLFSKKMFQRKYNQQNRFSAKWKRVSAEMTGYSAKHSSPTSAQKLFLPTGT